jgi:hypothetical protein
VHIDWDATVSPVSRAGEKNLLLSREAGIAMGTLSMGVVVNFESLALER